jgi:hypothetical protein
MKTFKNEIEVIHKTADAVPDISVVIPSDKPISQLPRVVNPALSYSATRGRGRGNFLESEYDLAQIGRIRDTESYVSQAFDKKVALMFKEGFTFVGKNPKTIKYIKQRFAQIARASGVSTIELLRNLGSNLIQKSNAFLVKVRKEEASGGKIHRDFIFNKELKPIAGYFPIPAETMNVDQEGYKIRKWEQKLPDGYYKDFMPEDIIHIHFNRKDGFIFGTPTLIPVIDDIRALRKIEENIELLIYQNLFPLFQFKVGTDARPAGLTETGEREIDVIRREIQYMPSEGGIVTDHRSDIQVIGAEGRALRAEKYLEHFKRRVIAGLGISSVDLGDGDTSNRSTADNMSRNLIDSVKDFQQILESCVDQLIINELLLESTFKEDVLNEDNQVHLKFKEIDITTQIKKEAHYADQFNKDILYHDEARISMGREPIVIPSQEEQEKDLDWASKYPEWAKMRWKMFKEPELLIQSIDEPYSLAAKAALSNRSVGMTQTEGTRSTKETAAAEKAKRPSSAAGIPTRTKLTKKVLNKDAFLSEHFNSIQNGIITYLNYRQVYDKNWIDKLLQINSAQIAEHMTALQMSYFRNSYLAVKDKIDSNYFSATRKAKIQFEQRSNFYLKKLIKDTTDILQRHLQNETEVSILGTKAREIFDTLQFRISAIEDVEVLKAKNLGTVLALLNQGEKEVFVLSTDKGCLTCKNRYNQSVLLDNILMEDIPPFHNKCECSLSRIPKIKDTLENQQDMLQLKPEDKKQDSSEECKQKLILKLKTKHPDWKQKKIESQAELLCEAMKLSEDEEE